VWQDGSLSLVTNDPLSIRTAEITLQGDPAIIADMVCTPGALFDEVSCMVWEESEELNPGVWHGLAVIIGADCEAVGPGELLRWDFSAVAAGVTDLVNVEAKLYAWDGSQYPEVEVLAPAEIIVGDLSATPSLGDALQLSHHPNPFNPTTTLSFTLPESHPVHINIYDINGRLVRNLLNENRDQGPHEVVWNGRGDDGRMQASGLYFSRIQAGPYSQVRKMTLAK